MEPQMSHAIFLSSVFIFISVFIIVQDLVKRKSSGALINFMFFLMFSCGVICLFVSLYTIISGLI